MFGKKSDQIKVGQGFVKGNPIDYGRKSELRGKIIRYGKMLAASYGLGPKDKKKMRNEMVKLNAELKKLEKQEKVADIKFKIAQKRKKISILNGQSGGSTNLGKAFAEIPDVIGGKGMGSGKKTKLHLPGPDKVPRYF